MSQLLIYGANGFTGRLIAEAAARRGLQPLIAGRSAGSIRQLGESLGLPWRAFPCQDADAIASELRQAGSRAVLHCAGPFSATSKPMLQACLKARTHYLDITGEIRVFERVLSKPELYRDAGIVAIPGVGFDVVPTDCVAALLKERLPEATELVLALWIAGKPSPGSFKTLTEGLHAGSLVRKAGKLTPVPAGSAWLDAPFADGPRRTIRVPWADVSTGWYSTGIPDIETYITIKPQVERLIRLSRHLGPLLRLRAVQELMKRWIERTVPGPDESSRSDSPYEIWGRVRAADGRTREMLIRTPNGYDVTVEAALRAAQRVLSGDVAPGSHTPSRAFGPRFVFELPGVEVLRETPG